MSIPSRLLALACASSVAIGLLGCQTIRNLQPSFAATPDPVRVRSRNHPLVTYSFDAVIDAQAFEYTRAFLTLSRTQEGLKNPDVINDVIEARCTERSVGNSLSCNALADLRFGRWYYQWSLEYGFSASDTATLVSPPDTGLSFMIPRPPGSDPASVPRYDPDED